VAITLTLSTLVPVDVSVAHRFKLVAAGFFMLSVARTVSGILITAWTSSCQQQQQQQQQQHHETFDCTLGSICGYIP